MTELLPLTLQGTDCQMVVSSYNLRTGTNQTRHMSDTSTDDLKNNGRLLISYCGGSPSIVFCFEPVPPPNKCYLKITKKNLFVTDGGLNIPRVHVLY